MQYSVMLFCCLVGTSSSVHFYEAVQILWHRSNSALVSGRSMRSAECSRASRNYTVPARVVRTPLSALIASYPGSKSKPSMSFYFTNTLTSPDSPQILTDPTPQHACISPFMVIILMLLLLQVWNRLALTMVQEQLESRSAE